jgi:carboxymethylenebutenolidase
MPPNSAPLVTTPAQGSGPGLVLLAPAASTAGIAALAQRLAEEGYVVCAGHAGNDSEFKALLAALQAQPQFVGGIGVVALEGRGAALRALSHETVKILVIYGDGSEPPPEVGLPKHVTLHAPGAGPLVQEKGKLTVFYYPECAPGFALPGNREFDGPWAEMAYSRTVSALKRAIGPHYSLEELWEYHSACEFVHKDATRTMRTMVAEPYVNHVPTMTGGVGHDLLKRFYKYHFVNQVPTTRRTIPISRTVGTDRLVDEKIFCFTHDTEIDWLLPGVAPTGRYVEIPLVGIITFRGDKLVNEHIYWDQASVLVQVGLLDPTGLPVCGVEQARKLADKSLPSNTLMAAWKTSEGQPL